MKLDPFIEAEKTAGHSVQKTCALFEVSKSAYLPTPQRRPLGPSGQRCRAARADPRHPQRIQLHVWRPADPQRAAPSPRPRRQAQGDQAHASGRPRGTVQEALAHHHRGRS